MVDAPPAVEACPAPEGASPRLAQVDATKRVAFLHAALDKAAEDAARWGWFWRAAFQVSAVAGWVLAPTFDDKANRIDAYATGFKSTVGFAFAAVFVLPAERHRNMYGADASPTTSCAAIAELETTLVHDAEGEARGRSVGMHLLGGAFNVAVGVTTGLMHHRWSTALSGMAVGGAVGSLRIFTQPTTASDALAIYRTGELGMKDTPPVSAAVVPVAGGAMFALGGTF